LEESVQASRFDQLQEAGNRFASTIGPNSVRIIVLVGTAAIGGTLSLAAKAPKLPGFGQVARAGGSIRAVLPRNAMAMSSEGGQVTTRTGALLSKTYRAFKSSRAFKRAMGSAGEGKNWHHIVEQHAGNLKRFGAEAIHNTENVIKLDTPLHNRVSAFYSSVRKELTNSTLTVRQWLSTQSYEAQRQFGLRAIENIQKGLWR
jgi:hypothetical protein